MLHRFYWSAWFFGSALIALSWVDIVTPSVGWVGFAIAASASFVSYLPQRQARKKEREWAVLTRAMIESQERGYEIAMERLQRGGTVFYDGMALAARGGDELWLAVVASAPVAEMDDVRVQRDVERAEADFGSLTRMCPELAAIAFDRKLRISLVSEHGARGFEICRVADGQIERKPGRAGVDRPTLSP